MRQGTAVIKRCTQSSMGRAIALQLASDGFDMALAEDSTQQAELAPSSTRSNRRGCDVVPISVMRPRKTKSSA
ncbi:hypothetical protein BDZ89DRAFT_258226 [Hymenopellis radicata]|nr:hypothetical protein BDZ89DRAFT_258226 [Hymenopellis radicata]